MLFSSSRVRIASSCLRPSHPRGSLREMKRNISASAVQSIYNSTRSIHPRPTLPWSSCSIRNPSTSSNPLFNHASSCPLWQQQQRGRAAVPLDDPALDIKKKPRIGSKSKGNGRMSEGKSQAESRKTQQQQFKGESTK